MPFSMIVLIAQCAVAALVSRVFYLCYFHPLARHPGPFLVCFTNLWRLFTFLSGQHYLAEQYLHEKYGALVRVAPNWLSFPGLDDFDAIYGWIMNNPLLSTLFRKAASSTGISTLVASAHVTIFRRPEEVSESAQPGIVKSWLEVPLNDPNRMTQGELFRKHSTWYLRDQAAWLQLGQPWSTSSDQRDITHLRRFFNGASYAITPGAETVVSSLSAPLPVGMTVSAKAHVLGQSREVWDDNAHQ
ncbi:hypothetical protein BBP40_000062 [Aspergillus hancockii]|nr:hypothetical protein BBP40_000062 [Aspergillus hancockii]